MQSLLGGVTILKSKINLNKHASSALLSPFAKMNSVSRLDMVNNAFKHCIVPIDPEYPIVDSSYTNDILLSTDNIFKKEVMLLHSIPKVINNYVTGHCYIYLNMELNRVEMVEIPQFELCYKFGYPATSIFEGKKSGEIFKDSYVKHFKFLDTENNIVSFGKNLTYIYNISEDIIEDSMVITESVANKFKKYHMDVVDTIISPEYILRDLYGENGEYKPIPLPGDKIKDNVVLAMYLDESKAFLAYDDDHILDSDIKKIIQYDGGYVVDVEVFSKDTIDNIPILEKTRQEYLDYMSKVVRAITQVSSEYKNIHESVNNIKEKYSAIINKRQLNLGPGGELKSNVFLRITTITEKPLEPGDKLTGRYGNKGTINKVVPDGSMVADDGTVIDCQLSSTGAVNRTNMAQFYEHTLTFFWMRFREYLNKSTDTNEQKKKELLTWLEYAKQFRTIKLLKDVDANELIEYYKNNDMMLTYKPYDDPDDDRYMNYDVILELGKYVQKINNIDNNAIYWDGEELSNRHYYGKGFFMVLNNGPFKDTSMRGADSTNSKGNPTKKSKDKKKHETKWGTTAVKQSDLAINIIINAIKEDYKPILKNNTAPLHDFLETLGIQVVFTEDDELDY